LGLDDLLGALQFLAQARILRLQYRNSMRLGLRHIRLRSALLRGQCASLVRLQLPAPLRQMRAVQSFTPQQRTDLTRLRAPRSRKHNAPLVRHRKLPPLRHREHFGFRTHHCTIHATNR